MVRYLLPLQGFSIKGGPNLFLKKENLREPNGAKYVFCVYISFVLAKFNSSNVLNGFFKDMHQNC